MLYVIYNNYVNVLVCLLLLVVAIFFYDSFVGTITLFSKEWVSINIGMNAPIYILATYPSVLRAAILTEN